MGRGINRKMNQYKKSTDLKLCKVCSYLREPVSRASKHLSLFHSEIASIVNKLNEAINSDSKSKFPAIDCKYLCDTKCLANTVIEKISKNKASYLVLVEKLYEKLSSLPDISFPSAIQKQCYLCLSTFLTTAKTISHIKLCHPEMLGLVFFLRSRPLSELNFYVNEVSIANITSEELLDKIACPRILGNRKLIIKVEKLSVHLHQDNITEECVNLNENNGTQSLVNLPTDTSLSSENSSVFHPFVTLRQKNQAQRSEIKFSSSESMSWSYFDEETGNEASINTRKSTYVPSDPRILEDEVNNLQPKTSTPKKTNIGIQLANYNLTRKLSTINRISPYVPSVPRILEDDENNRRPKTSTPKKSNFAIQLANYDLTRKLSTINRISPYVPSVPRTLEDDENNRRPKTSTPKKSNIGIQLANYGMKKNLANISRITFSSDDFSLEIDETSHEEDLE